MVKERAKKKKRERVMKWQRKVPLSPAEISIPVEIQSKLTWDLEKESHWKVIWNKTAGMLADPQETKVFVNQQGGDR